MPSRHVSSASRPSKKLSSAPAIIGGDLVRFVGLCPTKEGLIGALREAGLE